MTGGRRAAPDCYSSGGNVRARNITITALSTLAAATGVAPVQAHAADPVALVVKTQAMGCSDTDPSQAFCTVAAALASPSLVPGSTITVYGDHPENVEITTSGITVEAATGPFAGGPLTSVTVSGAQNVTVNGFQSTFTIAGSSNVALHRITSSALTVTDSQNVAIANSQLNSDGTAAAIRDSAGTSITHSQVTFGDPGAGDASGTAPGVTVTGGASQGTSFVGDLFHGGKGSAIVLTGGSSGAVIADDELGSSLDAPAVAVSGSTGNTIVGDTVRGAGQGVVATGGSTGLTIADDILFSEVAPPHTDFAGPQIVVDATSTGGSSIHHNIVDQVRTDFADHLAKLSNTSQIIGRRRDTYAFPVAQGPAYSWAGTVYQTAADLHSHTGQGTADLNVDPQFANELSGDYLAATSPAVDSADSSVPGWQNADFSGAARFQDPYVTGTGSGPTPYADRGAVEFQGGPAVDAVITPVTRPDPLATNGIDYGFAVDLSGSKSQFAPVKAYGIGDDGRPCASTTGTSAASPTGSVWYPLECVGPGTLRLTVTDTAGHTDQILVDVYAGPYYAGSTPAPPIVSPPAGAPAQPVVRRIGGTDRYQTSRLVSQAKWSYGQASAVVLARGDAAPDALAGVPLAAKERGPLLLTDPAGLSSADRAELDRVLGGPGSHKPVYILGGTAAVSSGVETDLRRAGYTVHRLSGGDRYGTALAVAHQYGPASHVIVATGRNFPDALAAGPLGAIEDAPIVLSDDTALDPATAAFVEAHTAVDAVGRQAWTATKALAGAGRTVTPLFGADRYQTAEFVAQQVVKMSGPVGNGGPAAVGVASGQTFPDALTGGAFAAALGLPLLLTQSDALVPATASVLHGWAAGLSSVTIFGGPAAITRPVADAITRSVNGKADY